jgi:phenylacetate-CoA ligase
MDMPGMRPIYLESWIHQKIRNEMGRSVDPLSRSSIDAYHLLKLREILAYSYERSSFYRKLFNECGLGHEVIRNLEDLTKIPLTDPSRLASQPYRFLCVSQAEVARPYTFATSGTTGPRKKIFWTRADIERITDFMAAGIMTVADTTDVVQILLLDSRPFSQADLLRRGVQKAGATAVVAGMESSAEEHLRIIKEHRSSVVFGYAAPLIRISRELREKHDLSASGVKILFLAGEYVPDARRQELESIWKCRVYTHYGLTEMGLGVAVECDARDGYHFNEADLLLEIVDPATGTPVKPGLEGELVFTTLTREAMPLIRYRTHDISRIIPEPCACGASTLLRIDQVKKRLESVIHLSSGQEIYPALLDDLLSGVPGIMEYRVVVTRQGSRDCLEFGIEAVEQRKELLMELEARLKRLTQSAELKLELLPRGALAAPGRAKKMIVDHRQITNDE